MKFDEILDEMNANHEPSESIRSMEKLRDIYEPKTYLNKSDKQMLLYYLEQENFHALLESISSSRVSTLFGIGDIKNTPFYGLSEEDIMYAWLYPKRIKEVE
jgi:hypothetical protein